MGGGGFAQYANNVIKSNRALLKKRKFKNMRELLIEQSGKTKLEFKQVSASELFRIKTEIRRKAKKSARIQLGVNVFCMTLVVAVLYWLFFMI